jgi:MFS family permease
MVAYAAPSERRGTSFGLFNLMSGIVLLFASLLAGGLWDHFGPAFVFYAGACFAAVALFGIVMQLRYPKPN